MRIKNWMVCLALGVFSLVGCEDGGYETYSKAPLNEAHSHSHDHDHGHGGEHAGAHGGHVFELDDAHGHHAELTFDSATRDLTLYFYGSEVGVAKPATGLAFEMEKDGKEVVLEAKASPLDGETDATASRFVVAGSQFPENIKSEEQLQAHCHVTIDGKEFVLELKPHVHDESAAHDDHAHGTHDEPAHDAHGHDDHSHEKSDPAAPAAGSGAAGSGTAGSGAAGAEASGSETPGTKAP